MASIFTRIISGDLPGQFVWRDERCVAFMSIAPLRPGHTLVVPIAEVDHWVDLEPDLVQHLMTVSHTIAKGIEAAFQPVKVGLMLAGLEVPHTHIHLVPIWGVHDLDFANADNEASPESIATAAEQIRGALRSQGASGVSG